MNKVILMGRLVRDPETRYTQSAEPMAITRYTIAVNRSFKKDNEPSADFIGIVAFGKRGEFADKYFKKGMQVAVSGRIQTGSYEKDGQKIYTTDVIVEEQFFADSKSANENRSESSSLNIDDGFYPINEGVEDDDLPF